MSSFKKFALFFAILGVAACSSKDNEDTYVARDVEVIYNLAKDSLEKRRYRLAATAFDEVERQHPYSIWAR
ncbi:MAG: outer membrane protein assembly factor BamD, partial [Kordiimonas sp.]